VVVVVVVAVVVDVGLFVSVGKIVTFVVVVVTDVELLEMDRISFFSLFFNVSLKSLAF
jgi:hypothetical protein